MANVDKIYGFKLVRTQGKPVIAKPYPKTAGTAIYPGDAVKQIAAGTVSKFAQGDAILLGIAAEYAEASATTVYVYDDPDYEYRCQITTYAAADAGLNTDISATDTADSDLRTSGNELDAAENAVTATLPFKILGLAPGQEAGANADVIVIMNNCVRGGGTGATGI